MVLTHSIRAALAALALAAPQAPAAAAQWLYDGSAYSRLPEPGADDPHGHYQNDDRPVRPRRRSATPPGPKDDALAMRARSAIARREVAHAGREPAGAIVISLSERRLRFVLGHGRALEYAIGVGREGFSWTGVETISRKAEWPDWTPPAEMRERRPDLPTHMKGGINNPLGARALYLGRTLYRIHGTNEPATIGRRVSSGCIRMTNADIIDLYARTRLGATVIVR